MSPHVRVGVGAMILQTDHEDPTNPRILVGKRLNVLGANKWAAPGGHQEFGESPEQTAVREVEEETGLIVHLPRFLTATNSYMPNDGKHYITMWIVSIRKDETQEPRNMEPDKCEGWRWMDMNELKALAQTETGRATLFEPVIALIRDRPEVLKDLRIIVRSIGHLPRTTSRPLPSS